MTPALALFQPPAHILSTFSFCEGRILFSWDERENLHLLQSQMSWSPLGLRLPREAMVSDVSFVCPEMRPSQAENTGF